MSLFARFWTLEAARRGELLEALKPVERKTRERRFVFFTRSSVEMVYPWSSYLAAHAREEARFPWSGVAFADLELMLPDRMGPFSLGLPESGELCFHCQASVALLDAGAAQIIRASLIATPLSRADILRFYEQDERPLAEPADADFILSAHHQLMVWSEQVTAQRLGLLMVG